MNTCRFAIAALLTICLNTLSQAQSATDTPIRDHVLLVTIDDLNDWIGCLTNQDSQPRDGHLTGQGHPQAKTPNLDALARRGVLFTNAHCQAPICRPSRTSIFSGLRPTTSGIYGNQAKYDAKGEKTAGKEVPWMTRRFENSGYEVFTAGKLLHASRNKPLGGLPCFRTNQGPYPKTKIDVPTEVTPNSIWDIGAFPPSLDDYTDLRIAKWTAKRIRQPLKPDDKPRFMALGFYNPHLPLFAPKKYFDASPSKQNVLLSATSDADLSDVPEIGKRIGSRAGYPQCKRWCLEDEQNLRTLTQAYLACTTAMDDSLGHVIEALDNSDMADNTWIVVMSDHGWHLGEKNHIAKQTLWSRATRVPMIIVPPKRLQGTPRGKRCNQPVELLDVYPTLVEATALSPTRSDEQLDGISLLPWISNPESNKERPAITTIYAHNHSVCNTRYRYTRYADGSQELYDRQQDPHEFNNIFQSTKSDDQLKKITEELASWIPKEEAGEPDLVDDRVQPNIN